MATVHTSSEPRRSALAEPTERVGGRWITLWTFSQFGIYLPLYGVMQILLPEQAENLAGSGGKVAAVGWATALAAVVTVIVNILVGALSDRTMARRGRRQAWVLGGALIAGVALAAQGTVRSVLLMVLVWGVVQIGLSTMSAATNAAVPDEVPVRQRGFVSAFMSIAQSAGPLIGVALVAAVITGIISGFVAIAVVTVLVAVPFALGTRGVPLTAAERPPFSWRAIVTGVVAPLKHADFSWAWSGRFFIQLSNALAQLYLLYFLQDRVHYADPQTGVLFLIVIYTLAAVLIAIPVGRWSDRTGRRKRIVVISSVLQGIAGLMLAFWPTWTMTMIGAGVLGLGFGAYLAVDQALITQVLPRAEDRGKDLGIINIANNLPYAITPVIAAPVIDHFGGYPVLYLLVLVTAMIAAVTVQPIKSVA
ncbi:MAG TPA: MFS transporter [Pseudonocardiaceae bacterium]|jgi:MFS family permease|nr:MFS transporter [Pseudonocardiaceae bacterium]